SPACVSSGPVAYRARSPLLFVPDRPHTVTSTLSLHDALPILEVEPNWVVTTSSAACSSTSRSSPMSSSICLVGAARTSATTSRRSEEHTSELQSRFDLVCRLLLEKKNKTAQRQEEETSDAHRL